MTTHFHREKKVNRIGEYIEGSAPEMLSLKMLKGIYQSLNNPHSIILSKSTAESIFGKDDPMYKNLKIDNQMDVQVTGIYEDIPRNNRFAEVQFFSAWALWVSSKGDWIKRIEGDWDNHMVNFYVQLLPNTNIEAANAVIKDLYYKNVPEDFF